MDDPYYLTMIDCISVENMRRSDALTIKNHVPSLELMGRAAKGVYLACAWTAPVAILVGSGNNGGDGFALACILHDNQIPCTVFRVSQKASNDSLYYCKKAEEAGIDIRSYESGCLEGYPTVVDCLLGTGFQGTVRSDYRIAIEEINKSDAFVVSVDINSGMNGDDGSAELAVRSDLTVTIGYVKRGLLTENAGRHIGRLVCADIGIVLENEEWKICAAWETLAENGILCPNWLDMQPIDAIS